MSKSPLAVVTAAETAGATVPAILTQDEISARKVQLEHPLLVADGTGRVVGNTSAAHGHAAEPMPLGSLHLLAAYSKQVARDEPGSRCSVWTTAVTMGSKADERSSLTVAVLAAPLVVAQD